MLLLTSGDFSLCLFYTISFKVLKSFFSSIYGPLLAVEDVLGGFSNKVLYFVGVLEFARDFSSRFFSVGILGGVLDWLLAKKECLFSRSLFSLGRRKVLPGSCVTVLLIFAFL
jgi:hypothetical protein